MTLPKHIKVGPFDFPVRPISQALGRRLCEDGDFDGDTIHIASAIATALTGVFRDNQNFAPWINDEANRTPSK